MSNTMIQNKGLSNKKSIVVAFIEILTDVCYHSKTIFKLCHIDGYINYNQYS